MNTKDRIIEAVKQAVEAAIKDGELPEESLKAQIKVEYPREQKFGDYSTPMALEFAKAARKSPIEIGQALAARLSGCHEIGEFDVVKPGFINIFISKEHLRKTVLDVIILDADYGSSKKKDPRKINIEFVSANPTGPLNIVSARAAAFGDSIAKLLEFTGDIVDREFYVNDYGNQVNLLGRSVLARLMELRGAEADFPEDGYHGGYIKDIAAFIEDRFSEELNNMSDETARVEFCAEKAVEYNVFGQKTDLEKFNVVFKNWFHERELHDRDRVRAAYDMLEKSGSLYSEEGKVLFRSTAYGDDKDRVVMRDDGRPTYLLADIAYHNDKISRGYDLIIDIWGPDHHGYIARLSGAMKALGYPAESFRVLIAQQVNLVLEGDIVKMSKRLGNFSTMSDLIEEIGVDVARYFFSQRSLESHLDFDLSLAKKQSSENPVFYLQYAHARICSIFREAAKRGVSYEPGIKSEDALLSDEADVLCKLILKFPEEVIDAAESFEPHRICTYLLRLAQGFHKFYTEHRVLSDDASRTVTFLTLADAARIVMRNGLNLLGVSSPEKM